jgi:hypothetical protein
VTAALSYPACLCAQSSGRLIVGEVRTVTGKRQASVEARIPISIPSGIHVNSDRPLDPSLIPLKLTWVSTGALTAEAVAFPKPTLEKYAFLDKALSVFTGDFEVVVKFRVGAAAAAGLGVASGKLRYQACSDRMCFPPKTVDVTVPYRVE